MWMDLWVPVKWCRYFSVICLLRRKFYLILISSFMTQPKWLYVYMSVKSTPNIAILRCPLWEFWAYVWFMHVYLIPVADITNISKFEVEFSKTVSHSYLAVQSYIICPLVGSSSRINREQVLLLYIVHWIMKTLIMLVRSSDKKYHIVTLLIVRWELCIYVFIDFCLFGWWIYV